MATVEEREEYLLTTPVLTVKKTESNVTANIYDLSPEYINDYISPKHLPFTTNYRINVSKRAVNQLTMNKQTLFIGVKPNKSEEIKSFVFSVGALGLIFGLPVAMRRLSKPHTYKSEETMAKLFCVSLWSLLMFKFGSIESQKQQLLTIGN